MLDSNIIQQSPKCYSVSHDWHNHSCMSKVKGEFECGNQWSSFTRGQSAKGGGGFMSCYAMVLTVPSPYSRSVVQFNAWTQLCVTLSSTIPVFILHNLLHSSSSVLPPSCLTDSLYDISYASIGWMDVHP